MIHYESPLVRIYTDGGYSIPRGVGGYAFLVVEDDKVTHRFSTTVEKESSARMEIRAFIAALEYAHQSHPDEEVEFYTDNSYVVNGYNIWMKGWKACGWKKADNKPIRNLDLWIIVDKLKSDKYHSYWVKGHNGDKYNEMVDSMTRDYLS